MSDTQAKWPWKYDYVPNLPAREFFARGQRELDRGDWLSALVSFEKAVQLERSPIHCTFLALCIARERGQQRTAMAICEGAIAIEPDNPLHYLNLGRIHLLRGDKVEAIRVFREGLKMGRLPLIIEELELLGVRKPPVISFLSRDNLINKYLGRLFAWLGLR
jgi:tetratricopeptide (TPR) repeat protein